MCRVRGDLRRAHRRPRRSLRPIASAPYYDIDAADPPAQVVSLARSIASPFYSVDVARTSDDRWIVLEVGDGGVSMLPPTMDPRALYRAMLEVRA